VAEVVRPGFWLQHGSEKAPELVGYSDALANEPGGRPGIVLAPVNAPSTLNPLFELARAKGDAFLDPIGHCIERGPTATKEKHFPWLTRRPRPDSQEAWKAWMDESVDHQDSAALRGTGPGPSILVTPSPVIAATSGQEELYAVLDAAAEVGGERASADTPVWLGLAVDRAHVREDPHRTRLGNAIFASGVSGAVFRAIHAEVPPVRDRRYLEGLREITFAAYAGSVDLMLPHAGWLGWLAMTWGAWGFSSGLAASSWGDREHGLPMRRPDEPSNPYFEWQLLRTVKWRVHEELKAVDGYEPCTCPECEAMGDTYDADAAKRHQIWWANEEAARIAPLDRAGRGTSVGGRLDAAIEFRDGLKTELQGRVGAEFLDVWRDLV
jgi:hypothetical protein